MNEPFFCPTCSEEVPDDSIWIVQGKFYCKQDCAEKAARIWAGTTYGTAL